MDKEVANKYIKMLKLTPHSKQRLIAESNKRFKVIVAGRRFGKSYYAALYEIIPMLLKKNKKVWIVAPTYELASRIFNEILKYINNLPNFIIYSSTKDMEIITISGSSLKGKSAKSPNSLLGEGIDLLVIDECANIPDVIYYSYLRPALSDRFGKGVFISSPKSKNWFYKLYENSSHNKNSDTDVFHFTTYDNPYIATDDILSVFNTLPESLFNEEYLACFSESKSFFNISSIDFSSIYRDAYKDEYIIIGIDLARKTDYTVVSALSQRTGEMIYFDRFNKIPWMSIVERIKKCTDSYRNYICYVDSTGVGDPIVEVLIENNINVESIIFTHKLKEQMVFNLSILLQNKKIKLIYEEIIAEEFENFKSFYINESVKYEGINFHDDIVMSLALACWGYKSQTSSDVLSSIIIL